MSDNSTSSHSPELEPPPSTTLRSPPKAVSVLLPVWGRHHVRQFLDFGLPSLLAKGNMPALAAALPCEFVLLTGGEDAAAIADHPAWHRLAAICAVSVRGIDDLISETSYSATITLAYARAIRDAGAEMLDTCFIFLVSDYVLADGSLRTVLDRLQAGASGVLAGNFQVVAEDAASSLRQWFDPDGVLTCAPRALLHSALRHLHPATAGCIVNDGFQGSAATNRLFWRVDRETLIGRFYLMHMIGIRPEVVDFLVEAACDYSFIPEMCPSNNVAVLCDSDDYLVVELQPRALPREANGEAIGAVLAPPTPPHAKALAAHLSTWTTALHRENARHQLVFHASDLPNGTAAVNAQADALIQEIGRHLSSPPQSHRGHPYWIGGIMLHQAVTGRTLAAASGNSPVHWRQGLTQLLWRIRLSALGRPPNVRPWHPRWPDFEIVRRALSTLLQGRGKLLIITDRPTTFAHWLSAVSQDCQAIAAERLLGYAKAQYLPLVGQFDACLVVSTSSALAPIEGIMERVGPMLKHGGVVAITATQDLSDDVSVLDPGFVSHAELAWQADGWAAQIREVHVSRMRRTVQRTLLRVGRAARQHSPVRLPFALTVAGLLAAASYACNWTALRNVRQSSKRHCSSVLVTLRSTVGTQDRRLPEFASHSEIRAGSLGIGAVGSPGASQSVQEAAPAVAVSPRGPHFTASSYLRRPAGGCVSNPGDAGRKAVSWQARG